MHINPQNVNNNPYNETLNKKMIDIFFIGSEATSLGPILFFLKLSKVFLSNKAMGRSPTHKFSITVFNGI